jgi:hypothetical protein
VRIGVAAVPFAAAAIVSLLGCRGERDARVVATPSAAAAPTATATVSPLPVEKSPAPSIYDRTPGVLHEEKGTPGPHPQRTRTALPRT